jgi:hypothetical protein
MALATLIAGYQILVLVERAASVERAPTFLPRSVGFWLIWGAAAVSLPVLMYFPAAADLASIAPLDGAGWLAALAAAVAAVGWRAIAARR